MIVDGGNAMLEFTTELEGIDIIHWDGEGLIDDFKVMVMNQLEISHFRITDLAKFDTIKIGDGPAMLLSAEALAKRRFIIDYPRNRLLVERDSD